MSHCGIEPQSDPCQGSILTIILVGLAFIALTLIFLFFSKKVHPVRVVVAVKARTACLCRQNSRRQRHGMNSHNGYDGNCRGERAFSKSGQVVNQCNFFHVFPRFLCFLSMFFILYNYII